MEPPRRTLYPAAAAVWMVGDPLQTQPVRAGGLAQLSDAVNESVYRTVVAKLSLSAIGGCSASRA